MSLTETFFWTRVLTVCALVTQSGELFCLRKLYSLEGPWSWHLIRQDFTALPKRCLHALDGLFNERCFFFLLGVHMGAALVFVFYPHPLLIIYLWLGTALSALRFRGSFNGGADAMTLVLLTALMVATLGRSSQTIVQASIYYIAIQSALSYLIAGGVKIKNPEWRSGRAFQNYILHAGYDVPESVRRLFFIPSVGRVAAWGLMLFELGVLGLPFMHGKIMGWLSAGLFFHLATFTVIGLNRFVWAWVATYPALFYLAHHFAGPGSP